MQFSTLAKSLLALTLVAGVIGSPLSNRDIASCETETAAQQVACIDGCAKDAACITSCTATAVSGYVGCAKA